MGDLPGLFSHSYISNVNSGAQLLPCPRSSPTCQCLLRGVKVTSWLREVRTKMTLWDGSLASGDDSWKWQQQLAISGSHFLYPLPPSPPPLSLPHALNPVSGPLVLGEGGREAGCCARLAAVTEELFIVEFWWFKSYGIAWNHCRNLEALQTAGTRALSLFLSLASPPPCLTLFPVITFSKLFSYFLFLSHSLLIFSALFSQPTLYLSFGSSHPLFLPPSFPLIPSGVKLTRELVSTSLPADVSKKIMFLKSRWNLSECCF